MSKIKVLIVDDAILVRKLLCDALGEDRDIEIVGIAQNGKIALQKIPLCKPDIITLDVEMPEMNGIETIRRIRELYPKLPVIMFSSITKEGATTTLEALSLGASDYVTKPISSGGPGTSAKNKIKGELLDKIKILCGRPVLAKMFNLTEPVPVPICPGQLHSSEKFSVVAMGLSTGGPTAIDTVLRKLPANFSLPIFVVIHMPPIFTKLLAERLESKLELHVHEASAGMLVKSGHVYLAPGDFHMALKKYGEQVEIVCHLEPPENSCRPAVDVLFRSVADVYGAGALGVIMTGMGQDGLLGAKAIYAAGGSIIVQDEQSSVVWGMPGSIVQAGLADAVVPLDNIANEIIVRTTKERSPKTVASTKSILSEV